MKLILKKKKSPTSVANPSRGAWRQSRQDLSCILTLPLDSSPTYAHVLTPSGVSAGIKGYPEGRRLLSGCLAPNRYSAVMTRGRLRNLWRTGSQTGTRDRVRAATGFSGREGEKGSDQEPSRMPGFGIKPPGEKTVRKRNGGYKQPNDGSGAGEAREGRVLK